MWHGGVGPAWLEEVTTYFSHDVLRRLMGQLDAAASRIAQDLDVEQLDLRRVVEPSLENLLRLLPRHARGREDRGGGRRCRPRRRAPRPGGRVARAQAGFLIMCGLAGVLVSSRPSAAELGDWTRRMIEPIAHRGPDDSGVWSDRRRRRRARVPPARDPRSLPARPSADVVAVRPVRDGLQRRGLQLRRAAPASWSRTGTASAATRTPRSCSPPSSGGASARRVGRFVGMFAIAVWDAERRELSLVRDRLGKKPLYVYREHGLVTFGSELKTLVAGPSFDRSDRSGRARLVPPVPVRAGAAEHLRQAIKMPAAHVLTLSDADLARFRRPGPTGRSRRRAQRKGAALPGHGRRGRRTSSKRSSRRRRAAACRRTSRSAHCSRAVSTRPPSWR